MFSSSQELVVFLSSSSDNVDIVRKSWLDNVLYVPRKADLILHWLLTRLIGAYTPLFDIRYWSLLLSIACTHYQSIPPLLLRLPPLSRPIITFLDHVSPDEHLLINAFAESFSLLFPYASRRISLEALGDIICAILRFLSKSWVNLSEREGITKLFVTILLEYKTAFGVASVAIKKKVYNSFVQTYFEHWIKAVVLLSEIDSLKSSVLAVGLTSVLSVDILKLTDCHLPNRDQDSTSKHLQLIDQLVPLLDKDEVKEPVLVFLPIFFTSYTQALCRHRSQLFAQASSRDAYRKTVCTFLDIIFGLLDRLEADPSSAPALWRARVDLLRVLWKEGGYIEYGEMAGPQEMLTNLVRRVIGVLNNTCTSAQPMSLEPLAIQSLSTIIQINYGIVKPVVPQILVRVMVLRLEGEDRHGDKFIEFLDLLLECHIKIRTLDELVAVILRGIWKGSFHTLRHGMVIDDESFLDRLGKAIRTFGTVGQCARLVGEVGTFVERGLGALGAVEKGDDATGLRLQLGAKIVCVVLAFLPLEMVVSSSEGEGKEKLDRLKDGIDREVGRLVRRLNKTETEQGVRLDIECGLCALLRMKYVLDRDVFGSSLGEGVDMDRKCVERLLRLLEREVQDEMGMSPDLMMEMVRTMLLYISTKQGQIVSTTVRPDRRRKEGKKGKGKGKEASDISINQGFFDTLLAFIELYYPRTETDSGWSGNDYDLTTRGREGKTKCAIALVWMIVERWLSEFDSLATPSQIRTFLNVVFRAGSVDLAKTEKKKKKKKKRIVDPEGILFNMLHSAWFWESGRIRNELITLVKEQTSVLSPDRRSRMRLLRERISTFRVLLYFPLEYFSFQLLSGFVGCAVEVDADLAGIWKRAEWEEGGGREEVMRGLGVLRVFLRRVCVYVGGGGVLDFRGKSEVDLLLKMLEEPFGVDGDSEVDESVEEGYLSASSDLAEVWLMRLFKSSKKHNDSSSVLRVLSSFTLDSICGKGGGHERTLIPKCFLRMVELLDREVGLGQSSNAGAGIHEEVGRALGALRDGLAEGSYDRIVKEILGEGLGDDRKVREYVGLVRMWDGLVCLERWVCLVVGRQPASRFIADKLVSVLMPYVQLRDEIDGDLEEFCVSVFSVLLGEVECRNLSRNVPGHNDGEDQALRPLEVVLAVYVSLANKVSSSGLNEMDVRLGRMVKRMAVSGFEHLLSFITTSLSEMDSRWTASESRTGLESRLGQLVHASSLLLWDHPTHSLACIQRFMSRCLGLFNDNLVYVEGDPTLRFNVLEMVGQYCSDQQAALTAQDTTLIWLLVSKFLSPSRIHDSDTGTEIFHKIVSILMSLIRLRRDLVALALPHLGMILRRLVLALRGCRPNLGAKQLAVVMNTQPRWISHTHPLGGEEAKALSRLLESLTVKSTVRVHFSSNNNAVDASAAPKAESLAKPFSRHAGCVLKAYVEAMDDPLCVMGLEVRREMREGLFALCGMMGVRGRDALMVGLNAGGKAVVKAVWKDWEEVRYVGKG